MNKYVELTKDMLTFHGDTEEEKKANELIYDLSLENDALFEENKKYKEVIDRAIKIIEDNYYSKNTTDIDKIVVSNNKLLQVRSILKEVE